MERVIPKNEAMSIIELMYHCCQPTVLTIEDYGVDLSNLNELESAVETSFDQPEFFRAMNELTEINKRLEKYAEVSAVRILMQRVGEAIKTGANRICEDCGGSGELNGHNNNPNAYDCKNCNGGGLL